MTGRIANAVMSQGTPGLGEWCAEHRRPCEKAPRREWSPARKQCTLCAGRSSELLPVFMTAKGLTSMRSLSRRSSPSCGRYDFDRPHAPMTSMSKVSHTIWLWPTPPARLLFTCTHVCVILRNCLAQFHPGNSFGTRAKTFKKSPIGSITSLFARENIKGFGMKGLNVARNACTPSLTE